MIMKDQATNLRILAGENRHYFPAAYGNSGQQTILVISGKGGVGKSFLSLYLAQALSNIGERVLLVDSNLQNPSLHILTNTDTAYPLNYWLGENRIVDEDAVVTLRKELDLLPNTAAFNGIHNNPEENAGFLLELLSPLASNYSYVVLDTQTALSQWNLTLLQNADMGLLVSITDPTSVIDTYTFIKASLQYLSQPNFRLIVNQVIGEETGMEAHHNLNLALRHFIDYEVELLGLIPFDMEVKRAGIEQKPLWQHTRHSEAINRIEKLAGLIKSVNTPKSQLYQNYKQEAQI